MKVDKDKSKAAVGTIVAHLLIVLVLFFMALRTPLPLPEEEGIEVDLGNSMEGMGDFQTNSPAPSQVQEQQEQEQQEQADKAKPSDNASEEIATEDNEEAPAITNTPKKPDTKKDNDNNVDKPKPETPKPVANPRALFQDKSGTGNGTGNQQGGSEGITSNPGDQGNPNGLAGIKNYSGNGGSGNGPSYKLGNRSHKSLTIPKQDFTEECTVTVDIWVNPEGKVVRAEAATKGTTTSSQKMKNMAIDAALKSTFSPDSEAPDEQHGTITYNFVINH